MKIMLTSIIWHPHGILIKSKKNIVQQVAMRKFLSKNVYNAQNDVSYTTRSLILKISLMPTETEKG